jgi:hypothetical protein
VTALTDTAVAELAPRIGTRAASRAVGAAQAGWYRRHRQAPAPGPPAAGAPPRPAPAARSVAR